MTVSGKRPGGYILCHSPADSPASVQKEQSHLEKLREGWGDGGAQEERVAGEMGGRTLLEDYDREGEDAISPEKEVERITGHRRGRVREESGRFVGPRAPLTPAPSTVRALRDLHLWYLHLPLALSLTHPNPAQLPPDAADPAARPLRAAAASTPEEEAQGPVSLSPAPELQGGEGARVPHHWAAPPSAPTPTPNSGKPPQPRSPQPRQ